MTGQFNVRVGELLHKQATIYSLESNTSLNNVVVEALNTFLKKSHRASVRHS
jgi:predicted HicB family RNase H-like nuclease